MSVEKKAPALPADPGGEDEVRAPGEVDRGELRAAIREELAAVLGPKEPEKKAPAKVEDGPAPKTRGDIADEIERRTAREVERLATVKERDDLKAENEKLKKIPPTPPVQAPGFGGKLRKALWGQ